MILNLIQLGRVDYATGLRLQETLVELRKQNRIGDALLLLEHDPVLTLGRNSNRANILASGDELTRRGIEVIETKRGGDVTYHGPGQLVGYPIVDLRGMFAREPGSAPLGSTHPEAARKGLGAVEYVRRLEEALIRTCAEFGVVTERICGLTGVWTAPSAAAESDDGRERCAENLGEKKIAAIGVHISRGITSHGFALNATTDLRDFSSIVPCGIADRGVTSLEQEMDTQRFALPDMEELSAVVARNMGWVLGRQVLWLDSLEALMEGAGVDASAEDAAGVEEGDVDTAGMGRP